MRRRALTRNARLPSPCSGTSIRRISTMPSRPVTFQGRISHVMLSPFGIRTISADAEHGFRLNGKTIKLTGTGFGGENACVGTASFDRAGIPKAGDNGGEFGFNTFRIQNCAPSAAFLEGLRPCGDAGSLSLLRVSHRAGVSVGLRARNLDGNATWPP